MKMLYVLRESLRLWLPSTRARRYHAALVTLLAIHRYPQLDQESKARIDAELVNIYEPLGIYPWWRHRRNVPPTAIAADRVAAMYRLDIPTGLPEVSWDLVLHPWHRQNPTLINQDFRYYHRDTDSALEFLASHGAASSELARFGTQ